MCLSIPQKITKIKDNHAVLDGGARVDLSLLKNIKEGAYIIVQNGFAVRKINKKEIKEILSL